jgi:hypothetical protein
MQGTSGEGKGQQARTTGRAPQGKESLAETTGRDHRTGPAGKEPQVAGRRGTSAEDKGQQARTRGSRAARRQAGNPQARNLRQSQQVENRVSPAVKERAPGTKSGGKETVRARSQGAIGRTPQARTAGRDPQARQWAEPRRWPGRRGTSAGTRGSRQGHRRTRQRRARHGKAKAARARKNRARAAEEQGRGRSRRQATQETEPGLNWAFAARGLRKSVLLGLKRARAARKAKQKTPKLGRDNHAPWGSGGSPPRTNKDTGKRATPVHRRSRAAARSTSLGVTGSGPPCASLKAWGQERCNWGWVSFISSQLDTFCSPNIVHGAHSVGDYPYGD